MWHHVMSRGVGRRSVFECRDDMRYFMALLARAVRRDEIAIHSFCFITNHFHLLLQSKGGLSSAIGRSKYRYAQRFNRRRGRRGPLFEGRFQSRVVDTMAYRRVLVRYIDDNPVSAGIVAAAEDYPYGSARAYARESGPPWLERAWIESEVAMICPAGRYHPDWYHARFPSELPTDVRDLVRRRIEVAYPGEDSFDDLIGGTPDAVREWMERCAELADGFPPGPPIATPERLGEALEFFAIGWDEWTCRRGIQRKFVNARGLASPGLLRDLCGLSAREICLHTSLPLSTVAGRLLAHRQALRQDPVYFERCAAVTSLVMTDMANACAIS